MKNLMKQASNTFYHDYEVLVCAGPGAGIGKKALGPLKKLMANPLKSKTAVSRATRRPRACRFVIKLAVCAGMNFKAVAVIKTCMKQGRTKKN